MLGYALSKTQPFQASGRQYDGIVFARIQLAESGIDIAPYRQHFQITALHFQHRLSAQARRPNTGALGQLF